MEEEQKTRKLRFLTPIERREEDQSSSGVKTHGRRNHLFSIHFVEEYPQREEFCDSRFFQELQYAFSNGERKDLVRFFAGLGVSEWRLKRALQSPEKLERLYAKTLRRLAS